jgi:hypothetical protein
MPCFGLSVKVLFLSLTFYENFVLGDLPVHCTQPQSLGVWRFHVGSYGGDSLCGYQTPDEQDGHHDLTPPVRDASKKERGSYWLSDKFQETYSLDVVLRDWNAEVLSVQDAGTTDFTGSLPSGEWTLVYDEGFHVAMKGQDPNLEHSFFSFYKFMLSDGDSAGSTDNFGNRKNSYCDHTLLGWYKRFDPTTGKHGKQQCFWGERVSTLEEAITSKQIPPQVAPVMPVPLDTGKGAKDATAEPKTLPDPGQGGFRGTTGAGPPTASNNEAEPQQKGKKTVMTAAMRIVLQIMMGISVVVAAMGMWAGTYHKDNPSTLSSVAWRVAIVCSMVIAAVSFAILWTHRGPYSVATAPSGVPAGPLAEKGKGGMTIKEWAAKMDADVQEAKVSGKPVRWTSDPDKLKLWLNERREKHGIEISEDSEVVKLLDLISPQLAHGVPGFGSNEVVGPQRAAAIQEQKEVAKRLGKDLKDLTNEDLSAARNVSQSTTNHHSDKSFTMNGKALAADGWKTLTHFDWRQVSLKMSNGETITDFVQDVPDQGGCGSCYAVAATSMFTSRLMLKYPELHEKFASAKGAERISVQQQLMCNQYNQACGGGYPYLVAKWAFENELKTDQCVESSSSESCPTSWSGKGCEDTFRVTTWRYVGGALGRCGLHHLCEAAMREELYKGGPMAVSVEPTGGFGYSDGVYHGVPGITEEGLLYEAHTMKDIPDCQDAECYIWRKVDHSVLLVGWGEDVSGDGKTCQARYPKIAETEKYDDPRCTAIKNEAECGQKKGCVWQGFLYWTIQNSYGKGFGKEGYLSFGPRGADPMRIESMVMAASVEWVNKGKPGHHQSRKVGHVNPHDQSRNSHVSHHHKLKATQL